MTSVPRLMQALETEQVLLADTTYLCKVKFDLSDIPVEQFDFCKGPMKRVFRQSKYCKAKVKIRVTMVATDLRFQVWFIPRDD